MVPIPSESAIQPDEKARSSRRLVLARHPRADAWSPDRPVELFLGMANELGIESIDRAQEAPHRGGGRRTSPSTSNRSGTSTPTATRSSPPLLHDELAARGVFPADHRADHRGQPRHRARPTKGGVPTSGSWSVRLALGASWGLCYAVTYRDEQAPARVPQGGRPAGRSSSRSSSADSKLLGPGTTVGGPVAPGRLHRPARSWAS